MTERERVERVAELMGWTRVDTIFWRNAEGVIGPLERFNPFASASDDYMVLRKVCDDWDSVALGQFAFELNRMARERWQADPKGELMAAPTLTRLRYLLPGDYTLAALAVVDAQIQETPG